MEQTVTLDKVQVAMLELRENGERISRRNVRAITGGGMSTVHRLMSQIQEAEALQNRAINNVSTTLQKALFTEIQNQIEKSTSNMMVHIGQLKEREEEALAALAQAEETIATLEAALNETEGKVRREHEIVSRAEATAQALQGHFDRTLQAAREEIRDLRLDLEVSRAERERSVFQIERLEQELAKTETRVEQLSSELATSRQKVADLEVRASTSKKVVERQRRQIAKMERRLAGGSVM